MESSTGTHLCFMGIHLKYLFLYSTPVPLSKKMKNNLGESGATPRTGTFLFQVLPSALLSAWASRESANSPHCLYTNAARKTAESNPRRTPTSRCAKKLDCVCVRPLPPWAEVAGVTTRPNINLRFILISTLHRP